MAFKMKGWQAHSNSPLHKKSYNSPLKNEEGESWLGKQWGKVKDWYKDTELKEIVDKFGSYEDPMERRIKARRHDELMNLRNNSDKAIAYRAAWEKKQQEKENQDS